MRGDVRARADDAQLSVLDQIADGAAGNPEARHDFADRHEGIGRGLADHHEGTGLHRRASVVKEAYPYTRTLTRDEANQTWLFQALAG
jgi:hypothetical protein